MYRRITIVGVGLIGGSLGKAAKQAGPAIRITGVDDPPALTAAAAAGAIDAAADSLEDGCREAELVILARTVEGILTDLGRLAGALPHPAVVLDVGGTKAEICRRAGSISDRPWHFVGGHPMAGTEKRGVGHARADLFRGRPFLLCPEAGCPPGRLDELQSFLAALGARPRTLPPGRHDFLVSAVSHLPQMVSVALAGLLADLGRDAPELADLAGPAARGMLRTAESDFGLWRGICSTNRDEIAARLQELEGELRRMRERLEPEAMAERFRTANRTAGRIRRGKP